MIFSSLWPMAVAWPIIALILWFSVGASLKPLSALADAIRARSPRQLGRIEVAGVPSEVVPVVASLNELLAVVEGALEREKQFTGNAAHELRTPLAGIKAQAEAGLGSRDEREKTEALEAINLGVERASRMVGQLLTLARVDPESAALNRHSLDLSALAAEVVARHFPAARAKRIELAVSGNEVAHMVPGEAQYLELLLSNLLDNAIRYSPEDSAVEVKLSQVAGEVCLEVEDSGPGIPRPDRARVFDRFVRLEGAPGEGSGIGLAIVKRIAELHGARIELCEPPGHPGLLVKVWLEGTSIFFSCAARR
jgi:two-component system sensor histidine kinase QseC